MTTERAESTGDFEGTHAPKSSGECTLVPVRETFRHKVREVEANTFVSYICCENCNVYVTARNTVASYCGCDKDENRNKVTIFCEQCEKR